MIVWRGKDKAAGERFLKLYVLPADSDAALKKDGDSWIIEARAIMGSKPVVVEKS